MTDWDKITGEWGGETVVIVGGGPSLLGFPFELLDEYDWKKIAINGSWRQPFKPDILFSLDEQFWTQYDGPVGDFDLVYVGRAGHTIEAPEGLVTLRGTEREGWSPDYAEGFAYGKHSGFAALQLACLLLGGERDSAWPSVVLLLGFDYYGRDGRAAWHHGGYHWLGEPPSEDVYASYLKDFDSVETCHGVYNLSTFSRLRRFKKDWIGHFMPEFCRGYE